MQVNYLNVSAFSSACILYQFSVLKLSVLSVPFALNLARYNCQIISVLLCKVLEVRSLLLGLVALVLSSSLLWGQVAIAVILDGEYE